ncbi:Scr1 family TA system antitoxin-like transcriptional regulator [Streptomyces antioxidans]
MAAQLTHLLKGAESPHITLQVLPFAAERPRPGQRPAGPALVFPVEAWTSFTSAVRGGQFSAA